MVPGGKMTKSAIRIVTCVKQVPDERNMETDPNTGSLQRDNAGSIPNPDDSAALEMAIRLSELLKDLAIECTMDALTMGPKQARASLRQALSLGFERGIHLFDNAFAGADVLATADTLASGIRKIGGADIVICGEKSADGGTGQVAAELSVCLNASFVPAVEKIISVDEKSIVLCSQLDTWRIITKADFPVVLQVKSNAAKLRPISFIDRRAAQTKPLLLLNNSDLEKSKRRGYAGSPTRVRKIYAPKKYREVKIYEGDEAVSVYEELKTNWKKSQIRSSVYFKKTEEKQSYTKLDRLSNSSKGPLVVYIENNKDGVKNGLEIISRLQKISACDITAFTVTEAPADLDKSFAKVLNNVDNLVIAQTDIGILTVEGVAKILAEYLEKNNAELCLLSATDFGKAVGPLVAALLKTGITADITELEFKEGEWTQIRPAYGGQVLAEIITPEHRPVMCTVCPGVWETQLNNNYKGRLIQLDYSKKHIELTTNILQRYSIEKDTILEDANHILIIGGAITTEEELDELIAYAKENNMEWGVTRPLVQGLLAPHSRQIGVSGLTIAPELALLVGVSGSTQTMSGLKRAGLIIAVNKDKNAPVFQNADYGFVGDWKKILRL